MAQNFYEGMFLIDGSKFSNDPDAAMQHVRDLLSKTGAKLSEDRVWLDGKLAYMIEGRRRGVHFLVYFKGDGNANGEIARQVKLSDLVLRHIVIRHPEVMFDRLVAAISTDDSTEPTTKATTETTKATTETTKAATDATKATTDAKAESETETPATDDSGTVPV